MAPTWTCPVRQAALKGFTLEFGSFNANVGEDLLRRQSSMQLMEARPGRRTGFGFISRTAAETESGRTAAARACR